MATPCFIAAFTWCNVHEFTLTVFHSVLFSCLIIPCVVIPQVCVFSAVMTWCVSTMKCFIGDILVPSNDSWLNCKSRGKKNLWSVRHLNLLPLNRQILFNCLGLFPPLNLLPVWAEGAVLIRPSGLVGRFFRSEVNYFSSGDRKCTAPSWLLWLQCYYCNTAA